MCVCLWTKCILPPSVVRHDICRQNYALERGLVVCFCDQPHYCNRPYYQTARFRPPRHTWSLLNHFLWLLVNHFSGPGRAIGRLCVCVCVCERNASCHPVWSDMTSVDRTTHWREDWSSASVINHTIVTGHTIKQPGFGPLVIHGLCWTIFCDHWSTTLL